MSFWIVFMNFYLHFHESRWKNANSLLFCYSRLYMYKLVIFFIAIKTTSVASNWHQQWNKYMWNTTLKFFTHLTKHKQGWWTVLFHYANRREKYMTIKLHLCIYEGRYQNYFIVNVMFLRNICNAYVIYKKNRNHYRIKKNNSKTFQCYPLTLVYILVKKLNSFLY